MKKNMASFADSGGPVGKTKQASASGATDIKNDVGGYSIVQANPRGGCSPLCRQSAFNHAKGYRGGDGDNANAGKVIL